MFILASDKIKIYPQLQLRSYLSDRIQFLLHGIFLLPARLSHEASYDCFTVSASGGCQGSCPDNWGVAKIFSKSHVISPPQDGSLRR